MKKLLTLVVVQDGERILLGMKKRGFGEGRFNGFGGKVRDGESIKEAAVRETQEEAMITVTDLVQQGVLQFTFEEGDDEVLEVHFFKATQYSGTPTETEEMKPQWFTLDEIPYDSMWPDDKYWLPELIKGKYFTGTFHFGGENDDVLYHTLNIVDKNTLT